MVGTRSFRNVHMKCRPHTCTHKFWHISSTLKHIWVHACHNSLQRCKPNVGVEGVAKFLLFIITIQILLLQSVLKCEFICHYTSGSCHHFNYIFNFNLRDFCYSSSKSHFGRVYVQTSNIFRSTDIFLNITQTAYPVTPVSLLHGGT